MASNPAAPDRSNAERWRRLKALQHPAMLPQSKGDLEYGEDGAHGRPTQARAFEWGGLPGASTRIDRLATLLGATVKQNSHGEHLALHCWHGEHGPYTPGPAALDLLLPSAPEEVRDSERWLFLDTETTGLCGGTGTYPFLVGLAWWERGGLEIEQLFMREFSEERSLLAALSDRMNERPVLVTFNGKSFDWPLLETRFRMTRSLTPPAPRAHLDFLHPARNLWKLRLGSVRLSQLERHVLGSDRGEDLDSAQIPRLYLDYVRGGAADPLVPVFLHNQMDLRGLAGLARRILALLGDETSTPQDKDGLELFGLSRMCERRGQAARARRLYEESIGLALPGATDRAARSALALLAKRDGDLARARELWEMLRGNSREGYEAYEQLAIYYEHQARDLPRALAITCEALAQLRRARDLRLITATAYHTAKAGFDHRLARLERKSANQVIGSSGDRAIIRAIDLFSYNS